MGGTLQDELKEAIARRDFATAELALQCGADLNARDWDGSSPLTWAACGSDAPSAAAEVSWALEHGARVCEEKPEDGSTSVHLTAEHGDVEALRLLLAADGKVALEKFDEIDRTPLMCAVASGNREAVGLLIAAGSNLDAHREERAGNSAISLAVETRNVAIVEQLLRAGADPTVRGWMQLNAIDRAAHWKASPDAELRRGHALLVARLRSG